MLEVFLEIAAIQHVTARTKALPVLSTACGVATISPAVNAGNSQV